MKYSDLEQLALEGKLILKKEIYRERVRNQYIWDKNYEHILEVKNIPYKVYSYQAWTEDTDKNSFIGLRKDDYNKLVKICEEANKEKS